MFGFGYGNGEFCLTTKTFEFQLFFAIVNRSGEVADIAPRAGKNPTYFENWFQSGEVAEWSIAANC